MRGRRGSVLTSTTWIREDRKPGMIRCERSGPWQADEQRFQPKWWSSSPTFGIGSSWTIRPSSVSTTARKSGSSTPVPSCRQVRYRNSSRGACITSSGEP
jgi:hypothetical protein